MTPASRRDLLKLTGLALARACSAGLRQCDRKTTGEDHAHPDPGRHRLHRAAPGPLRAGARPSRHHLQPRPQQTDWPGPVEELLGDRNTGDLKALEGREWDVCIDNPTTLPFWVRDAGHVLAGKVGQYIFISTISVYAANDTPAPTRPPRSSAYTGKDPMAETIDTLRADVGGSTAR